MTESLNILDILPRCYKIYIKDTRYIKKKVKKNHIFFPIIWIEYYLVAEALFVCFLFILI